MVMKTPGVYIEERSAFPNSVVQVATAIPAFIGYTEKAMKGNFSVAGVPTKINTLGEFHAIYGGSSKPMYKIKEFEERSTAPYAEGADPNKPAELPQAVFIANGPRGAEKFELIQTSTPYCFYAAMRAFFANGGGTCYVCSIGSYKEKVIDSGAMMKAITKFEKVPDATMVVIPETVRLTRQNAAKVQQAMMAHSGEKMANRFAILDIHGGYLDEGEQGGNSIDRFRMDVGTKCLDYAAAYYPWLNSSIYTSRDFTFENIDLGSRNKLISLLKRSVGSNDTLRNEIKKVGTAEVSGDMTISVKSGETTLLKASDVQALDDIAEAGDLNFTVVDAPEGITDEMKGDASKLTDEIKEDIAKLEKAMAGRLIETAKPDAPVPVYAFSQKDINDGKISFKHDASLDRATGSFGVIVTDNEGIQTGEHIIAVTTGNEVTTLSDVGKEKEVSIPLAAVGADEGTIVLIDAKPVDANAEYRKSDEVKAAQKAVDDAPDDIKPADLKKLEDALDTAKAAAVAAVEGKTRIIPGTGEWRVDGTDVIFKPFPTFKGTEIAAQYTFLKGGAPQPRQDIKILVDEVMPEDADDPAPLTMTVDKAMRSQVPLYGDVMNAITKHMNVMSPGAAMAGIYTSVDNSRGVWKAPANVSVSAVASPMFEIDNVQQADLNVSTTGKSINAIRPFVGEGTLVWGARTLDGNSLDWRYINVRRTMLMLEESIKLACKAYVFEPNTAGTWTTMRAMIENFLNTIWKAGGLAGSTPDQAYSVHVGLGETMDPVDILEGRLLIDVYVAVVRPAEFIKVAFEQKMQES